MHFCQILFLVGLPLARGLQLTPLSAPAVRTRSTAPRLAEEPSTGTPKGLEVGPLGELPILTLEERGDGWDDVRQSIIQAKKEREPAVEELKKWNEKYLVPAAKWTKVIVEEVAGTELSAPDVPKLSAPKLSAPKLSAPKLPTTKLDKKKVTKKAVSSVAGVIDKLPKKKPKSRSPKKATKSPAPEAAANVFLLLGVPGLTLLGLAYVGLPYFIK